MKIFEDKRLLAYEGRRTLLAVAGAAIYALGTNLFIVPRACTAAALWVCARWCGRCWWIIWACPWVMWI